VDVPSGRSDPGGRIVIPTPPTDESVVGTDQKVVVFMRLWPAPVGEIVPGTQ
jgi:hypothetical protein